MNESYWARYWNRRRLLAAAVAGGVGTVGLGIVGCGGDSKDSATPTSGNSKPSVAANPDLIPKGLADVYPLIAKYHWSKSTYNPATPKRGGRLQLRLLFDTASWDPFDPGTAGVQNVPMNLFYNRLLVPNLSMTDAMAGKGNLFNLDLQGDLAKSWEQPDERTYVFHLNENVKWSNTSPVNGRNLTSHDVLYTYDAYLKEHSVAQADTFRDVDKFETPDDLTFKITTKKPVAYLINELSAPLAFVVAPEAREKGLLKQDPPIGTGPFVMKEHKYRNTLQVDKNPNYFKNGLPYLDGIDFTWILDATAAVAAYTTGKFDAFNYIYASGFSTVDQILGDMGWTGTGGKTDLIVQQQNNGGDTTYYYRIDQKPFDDVRVRRALSMAIDREKQLLTLSGGKDKGRWSIQKPTDWIVPDDKPWPLASTDFPEWYRYDPGKAKALLSEAGFAPGQLKIELLGTSGTAVPAPILALIQEDWKAIGVEVNIKLIDQVALQTLYYTNKLGAFQVLGGVSAPSGMDLDDFTYRSLRSGAVNNQIGVSDPELDKLLDAQQAEFNREKRKAIGRQIVARELDQAYRLYMTTTLYWEFKRPWVQNWHSHDVYMFNNGWALNMAESTWLDK